MKQIDYYLRFAAKVGLATEYGRSETKDQLLDRLREALKELAALPERRPTRLAPDRTKRAAKSKPSASKRSKSGAAGKA